MKELLRSVSSSYTYPVPPFLLPHSFSPLATQVSPCRWKTNAARATFEECCWRWFSTESQNFATWVALSTGHEVFHCCTILPYLCICCVLNTYHLLQQSNFYSVLKCTVCICTQYNCSAIWIGFSYTLIFVAVTLPRSFPLFALLFCHTCSKCCSATLAQNVVLPHLLNTGHPSSVRDN